MKQFILLLTAFIFVACGKQEYTTTDSELFEELHEPLVQTMFFAGKTEKTYRNGEQALSYSFIKNIDVTSSVELKISYSRNMSFHDCSGCIGDSDTGILTPPKMMPVERNMSGLLGHTLTLNEFLYYMISSHGEVQDKSNLNSYAFSYVWRTDFGYTWVYRKFKDNTLMIAASKNRASWEVFHDLSTENKQVVAETSFACGDK